MSLLRGAYAATASVRGGEWPRQSCIGREIAGKRLGLVGFGGIGQATARLMRAFGAKVHAINRSGRTEESGEPLRPVGRDRVLGDREQGAHHHQQRGADPEGGGQLRRTGRGRERPLLTQVDDRRALLEALMARISGPDFPTGGMVCGREGIRDAYRTGRGRCYIRARADIEDMDEGGSSN